jgi:hypothetical protein
VSLAEHTLDELLEEVERRTSYGVAAFAELDPETQDRKRTLCWWGDVDLCLAVATLCQHGLEHEITKPGQAASQPETPTVDYPQNGLYL